MPRDPRDYTIEVCIRCGCQLSRDTPAGRCVNRDHWSAGSMEVKVIPLPLIDQTRRVQNNWHAIQTAAERR